MQGYSPETAEACKMLRATITHLEKSTLESRLANIKVAKKFARLKRAAEEFINSVRRL